MKYMIKSVSDEEQKKNIARQILKALPEWFGIPESTEKYISESGEQEMLVAFENEAPIGFISLKKTGKDTVELVVMGVKKEYHRQGIGKELFNTAKCAVRDKGYSFIQVKTVQMGKYKEYDATNMFYLSLGFKEFEVFPTLWDEWNPCQIYVMAI